MYRVGLYKVLSRQGFNVVTFDYRGFGDSIPSMETNTVARELEDVHISELMRSMPSTFV